MDNKKNSTKIIAVILTVAVILGTALTLNAVSKADEGEFKVLEQDNYIGSEKDSGYTPLDSSNYDSEAEKEGNSEGESENSSEKKAEGTSGKPTTFATYPLFPRAALDIVLRGDSSNPRKNYGDDAISATAADIVLIPDGAKIDFTTPETGLGKNTTYVIAAPGTYTFTGTTIDHANDAIRVLKGTTGVTIILDNVVIETIFTVSPPQNRRAAPITIEGGGGNVLVQLVGSNRLVSDNGVYNSASDNYSRTRAGLEIRSGSKLTIEGSGSLYAANAPNEILDPNINLGKGAAAGIGGGTGYDRAPGDIFIKSGNIEAHGGSHGSGVGSGWHNGDSLYHILISGGDVISTGGYHGNGLGGSCESFNYGVIVVVPPSNVTASSKATSITQADIDAASTTTIRDNLIIAREKFTDIGSAGRDTTSIPGQKLPLVFYMGEESINSQKSSTVFMGDSAGFQASGEIYRIHPASITSGNTPTEEVELVLSIIPDPADNVNMAKYQNLKPALELFGTQAEYEAFFSKLDFGTLSPTVTEIHRVSLLYTEAEIRRKDGDTGFQSSAIGPSTGHTTAEITADPDIQIEVDKLGPLPTYMKGAWLVDGASLAFDEYAFEIEEKVLTPPEPLMYGFTDGAEANASKYELIIFNESIKNPQTGFVVSKDISDIKLLKDLGLDINNFTISGVDDTTGIITDLLKHAEDAKNVPDANKVIGFTPNAKDSTGKFLPVGKLTVDGHISGKKAESHEFEYELSIIKGDYIDDRTPKDASDISSKAAAEARLQQHFKLSGVITKPIGTTKNINLTNNEVKLEYIIEDPNLLTNGTTTAKYIILKKGTNIPTKTDPRWVSFTDGEKISFPANTDDEMVIYYLVENPWMDVRGIIGEYLVDLIKPEVKKVTQFIGTGVTAGYISFADETIEFEFTEKIWNFDENSIVIERVGKTNTGHFSVVPGSVVSGSDSVKPSLKIRVDASKISEIDNLEEIEISVKGSVVEDKLGNENLSSTASAAPDTDTILKLVFIKEKPTVSISDDIESGARVFKHNPKTIDVTVFAKNVTPNKGTMYKNEGQINPLTSAEILADQTHYKNYIIITDKKTGLVVNYPNITYVTDEPTGGIFTLDFGPNGLADGDYEIKVVGEYIFNELGIPAEEKIAEFSVRAPAISNNGATIDKIYFEPEGGKATITINGKYLTEASEFTITEDGGKLPAITIKPPYHNTKLDAVVEFPKNISYDDQHKYKFTITGKITGEPDIVPVVVVDKSNPTLGQAEVIVNRVKSIVKFDLNGGTSDIKEIVADKMTGNKGGFFDFSEYDYEKAKAPTKKDHLFLGWYLEDGTRAIEKLDLKVMGGGVYTLKAMWIDLRDIVDEEDDGGDKSDPDIHGDAKIFVVNPARNTARYVNENTLKEIIASIGGWVEITPAPGYTTIKIPLSFIWDNSDVSIAGIKKGRVAITNPQTKEPILQPFTTYVYITNYPYITNRSFVSFQQYERVTPDGSEWSPKIVEEIPDFSLRQIVIKSHTAGFDPYGFTTDYPGLYTVGFTGTITTYRGVKGYIVPPTTGQALVMPRDEGAEIEWNRQAAEEKYWINASESLHLLYKDMGWQIDKDNYIFNGREIEDFKAPKEYDRMILAEANSFPMMSAEILQILKEQDNSLVDVRYGEVTWKFHSKDFKDEIILPTGFFDLGYSTGNTNENINNILKDRKQQQIAFKMNKPFMGQGELTLRLNKELRESKNLNLFHYNSGSNELELVGKMTKNTDGTVSIKLSEVRNDYVILEGLSKDSTSKKVLSYRITDITKEFDKTTKTEIEKDLKSVGKDIKTITAKTTDDTDLKFITSQDYNEIKKVADNRKIIIVSSITATVIIALSVVAYLYLRKKRNETQEEAD